MIQKDMTDKFHVEDRQALPEEKSHMVLPEIEEEFEEDDEGQKLSLTSLLLGKELI